MNPPESTAHTVQKTIRSCRKSARTGPGILLAGVALLSAAVLAPLGLNAQSQTYTFSTLAGFAGDTGVSDGTGIDIGLPLFNGPSGLVVNGSGNLIVADASNSLLRVVTPAGVVTTLVGSRGVSGFSDGTGAAASFSSPQGPAIDSSGNIYVADYTGETVRKITPAGVVTTLAGQAGTTGTANGTGTAAQFFAPTSVGVDASDNVYVADSGNNAIRKITPTGVVTTFAGNSAAAAGFADGTGTAAVFSNPRGLAVDSAGNIYVADTGNNAIRKITPAGVVTTIAGKTGTFGSTDAVGSAARFNFPNGVAVDSAGNVYVADELNNSIRKVATDGTVTTFAGSTTGGVADGTGSAAKFSKPTGVALDGNGNLYVTDYNNELIRKITPAGVVTTVAGDATVPGDDDGSGYTLTPVVFALFRGPTSTAVDAAGNIYVTDTRNNNVRQITPAGLVTTLAGNYNGAGVTDGTGVAAFFNNPTGIAADTAGNVYVADTNNQTIRKITHAGVVTTLAGTAGTVGHTDGTGTAATFNFPSDVAIDAAGNLYVSDYFNHAIRKITAGGVVTTLAGSAGTVGHADGSGTSATFSHPRSLAVDSSGNIYVADTGNHTVRKITAAGVVTTLAGTAGTVGHADGTGAAASFNGLAGVAVDGTGTIFVADTVNSTIRQITSAGVVTTIGGTVGTPGYLDGVGTASQFNYPTGLAFDAAGNLYIADNRNFTIRKGTTPASIAASGGSGGSGTGSGTGSGGTGSGTGSTGTGTGSTGSGGTGSAGTGFFLHPGGVSEDISGNVYIADTANHTIKRIATDGTVTGVAGKEGVSGSNDANLAVDARFNGPTGILVDSSGNVFVADTGNGTIREITSLGVVTTIAGSAGNHGTQDGTGSGAQFSSPTGIAVDASSNLYVTDTANNTIRMITPTHVVTTIAGTAKKVGDADGVGSAALFNNPTGMTVDSSSNLFVADTFNNTIRKISTAAVNNLAADGTTVLSTTPAYTVTTVAGSAGISGAYDGTGIFALFNLPQGLSIDTFNNLYVADTGNNCIRRVTNAGVSATIAGIAGIAGNRDGATGSALFNQPQALRVGSAFYVVDTGNSLIRIIQPSSVVITPTLKVPTTVTTGTGTGTTTPTGTVTVIPNVGAGGGAPSLWFYSSLLLLGLGRRFVRPRR